MAVTSDDLLAGRLYNAIRAAGVPIESVSIGDVASRATWTVLPSSLQAAAQPTIDAFNPTDPAHDSAELEAAAIAAIDRQRLAAAIVWTLLKQQYPADTDAQTKTKYGVARQRVIDAFKAQPWK